MEEEKKLIKPDADQIAFTKKRLKDLQFAMTNFIKGFEDLTLDEEFAATLLSNARMQIDRLSECLKVPTESAQVSQMTRALNQDRADRMAQLERDLASKSDVASSIFKIKAIFEETEKWWRDTGLGGWLDSAAINKGGNMEFKLWVVIDKLNSLSDSETPVSDRKGFENGVEELKREGWLLSQEGRSEYNLIDCDANRKKLIGIVRDRFPGCSITEWDTRRTCRNGDEFLINKVGVHFRDVAKHFDPELLEVK